MTIFVLILIFNAIAIILILIMIIVECVNRCAECVAIGECGLDFNRNFSPPEVQIEVFEKQVILIRLVIIMGRENHDHDHYQNMYMIINQDDACNICDHDKDFDDHQVLLACELGKPLFLHERDAHPEMVSILER